MLNRKIGSLMIGMMLLLSFSVFAVAETPEEYQEAFMTSEPQHNMASTEEETVFSEKGMLEEKESAQKTNDAETVFAAFRQESVVLSTKEAINLAREYGEKLDTIDAQLTYCAFLRENGFDLRAVYPNGVEVKDDLSLYQFLAINPESGEEPDYSRILILSREANEPSLEVSAIEEEEAVSDLANDTASEIVINGSYTVTLHPEWMEVLDESNRASSIEECTAIVLLDRGYIPNGNIFIRTTGEDRLYHYNMLKYYSAYEAIAVYDSARPQIAMIYNAYLNTPLIVDSVVGKCSDDKEDAVEKLEEKPHDIQNEWGDCILLPDKTLDGGVNTVQGTIENLDQWNIEPYMFADFEPDWLEKEIKNGALESLSLLFKDDQRHGASLQSEQPEGAANDIRKSPIRNRLEIPD